MNEYHLIASNDHLAWQSGSNNKDRFNLVNKPRHITLIWPSPACLSLPSTWMKPTLHVDNSNIYHSTLCVGLLSNMASLIDKCRIRLSGRRCADTYTFNLQAYYDDASIIDFDFVPGRLKHILYPRWVVVTNDDRVCHAGECDAEISIDRGKVKKVYDLYDVEAEYFDGMIVCSEIWYVKLTL